MSKNQTPKRLFRQLHMRRDQSDRLATKYRQRGLSKAQAAAAVVADVRETLAGLFPGRQVAVRRFLNEAIS